MVEELHKVKDMDRDMDSIAYDVVMIHKYRGSIIVLSISKSVKHNEEQAKMISGFQQGIICKY